MAEPLFLYSTQSNLAKYINYTFYQDIHYVWCSPFFEPRIGDPALHPAATPRFIYRAFLSEVTNGAGPQILQNVGGIKRGADQKLRNGVIDADQHEKIVTLSDGCVRLERKWFKPTLYIVPFCIVRDQALLDSENQYIIANLKQAQFHEFDPEGLTGV